MFDSALVRRPGLIEGKADIGRVLETLLYYRQVHFVLDLQILGGLVDSLGMEAFKDILALPHVTADLVAPEIVGVHTVGGPLKFHSPVYARYSGVVPRGEDQNIEAIHEYLSNQRTAKSPTLSDVRKMLAPARSTSYANLVGTEAQTNSLFESIAADPETVRLVVDKIARSVGVRLDATKLQKFTHSLTRADEGFLVGADGWDVLFRPAAPPADFSWGKVFASIFEYSLDLQLAGNLSTDVVVEDEASELAVARIDLAIQRAARRRGQVSSFEELTFGKARFFSGAVNDGSLSIAKALSVIEKSADLRKWTSGLAPTSNLAQEYVQAVSAQNPLDRLGPSSLRFFAFTGSGVALDVIGAGGVGTAIGVSLSAFDQFLLSRLFSGWRPNTFVNRLKRTVD